MLDNFAAPLTQLFTVSARHVYFTFTVSDLVFARNCCVAQMLPGEAELVSE